MRRFSKILAGLSLGASPWLLCAARADTVVIKPTESSSPFVYTNVKVIDVQQGKIQFQTSPSNQVDKDFSTVISLSLDDEPAFNQAEHDIAANRPELAVDEYDQTVKKTGKAWLKLLVEPRLLKAANAAGRFDKAVEAYIAVSKQDFSLVAKQRPSVPQFGSSTLEPAASALTSAAEDATLKPDQLSAILSLLLDVQRARHDNAAINAVSKRLSGGGSLVSVPAANALADAKIQQASDAAEHGQFDQAIAMINGSRTMFLDAGRQADALYILARAAEGQAAAKNDPDAWKDAAIAYLRVVGDFKDISGAPHVADSMVHAGAILEKINQNAAALELYQNVISAYPKTAAADQARGAIDRINGK